MTKHKKDKRTKADKKQKHINISNKNEIHIKIETGKRKSKNQKKNDKGSFKRLLGDGRQYPMTQSYYQPQMPAPVPAKPELDYTNLAKQYLVKDKIPDIVDVLPSEVKTPLKTPKTIFKRSTTPLRKTSKKSKEVNLNSYDDLMAVKTIKRLKEIFRNAGISEDILKKFTKETQRDYVVTQFLARDKSKESQPSAALARDHPSFNQTASSSGDFEGDTRHTATSEPSFATNDRMVVSYTGKKPSQPVPLPTYRMAVSDTPKSFDPIFRRGDFSFQPNWPMTVSETPQTFQDQRPTTSSLALTTIDSPIFENYDQEFPTMTSSRKALPTPKQLQELTPLKKATETPISPPHPIVRQREELDTPSPGYNQIISPTREQLETSIDHTPEHPFVEERRGGKQIRETTPISFTPPSVLGKNTEKTPTGETPELKSPRNSSGFPQSFLKATPTGGEYYSKPAQPSRRGGHFTGRNKG